MISDMATIRPFHGLRFSGTAGELSTNVAPPYDVLSQEERDAFAAKSPCNIVHLTLPEQNADDRSKFVKYARSASRLESWRKEGALAVEEKPAFYRYRQFFNIPGHPERLERLALIALIKVEPYDKGVVLPHEQTFPKHKEDRLRILEATRAHLECIFGLYEDDDREVLDLVRTAPSEKVADVTTDDGVQHVVEVITDAAANKQIVEAMASQKVWIADGHHRYETACTFREMKGQANDLIPEDFMMMAFSSMSDPGLVLLPTHRILKTMPVSDEELKAKLTPHFSLQECPNSELMKSIEAKAEGGARSFGVAIPGGTGFTATVNDLAALGKLVDSDGSDRLQQLDVTILHDVIFGEFLGLTGLDFFGYTRDEQEAVEAVENGAPLAILMNPPTVEDMRQIALGGEKMPQKSTFYYPKILSGLVLWSLNDF
ncbi:MAG: DUF1015 domain-containing protein [Armatimonadetes bacterium]|nr:DUF1015 domain-containing protein [Armatimonadota bacterium]